MINYIAKSLKMTFPLSLIQDYEENQCRTYLHDLSARHVMEKWTDGYTFEHFSDGWAKR